MNIEYIDFKDLVLIGGGLFTLAIIFHGIWLAWRSRREPLRLDISPELLPTDEDDGLTSELPNGGGRPVRPTQENLGFEEEAPSTIDAEQTPELETQPAISATAPAESERIDAQQPEVEEETAPVTTGSTEEAPPIHAEVADPEFPDTGAIVAGSPTRRRFGERREVKRPDATAQTAADAQRPELLVINLLAPEGEQFTGEQLLAAMRAQGLRYGAMSIFHRFDPATREVKFSVANIVEPGHFDLGEITEFLSPGLVFFLGLPGPTNPSEAIEDMIRIARAIADELGASLKDEEMHPLTPQTAEHYRGRVADFSRRLLSNRHDRHVEVA